MLDWIFDLVVAFVDAIISMILRLFGIHKKNIVMQCIAYVFMIIIIIGSFYGIYVFLIHKYLGFI